MSSLKWLAIVGNVLFIAWMSWNGIDEGFKASRLHFASYLSLTILLLLNIYLITSRK